MGFQINADRPKEKAIFGACHHLQLISHLRFVFMCKSKVNHFHLGVGGSRLEGGGGGGLTNATFN